MPEDELTAEFNDDSVLELTPELTGATETKNAGIIGESVDLTLAHTGEVRPSQVVYALTAYLLSTRFRDADGDPRLHLFGQLKRIVREWVDNRLVCKGGANASQLAYKTIADMACAKIAAGVTRARLAKDMPPMVILDPYNPTGSTAHVNFHTSKTSRYETDSRRCHLNWAILDSDWEADLCRAVEGHPRVKTYVKNHNLGFEVPYSIGSETRRYVPDFIVLVRDRHQDRDFLHLVVEIKGYRGEDAKLKKEVMETCWIPGVNRLGTYGRWAFAELTDVYAMESDFADRVNQEARGLIKEVLPAAEIEAARNLAEAGGSMPNLEYIPRRKSEIWE